MAASPPTPPAPDRRPTPVVLVAAAVLFVVALVVNAFVPALPTDTLSDRMHGSLWFPNAVAAACGLALLVLLLVHYWRAFSTRPWVPFALYAAGICYFLVVLLMLVVPGWFAIERRPGLRFALWFAGVVELVLVVARWWAEAIHRPLPAAGPPALPTTAAGARRAAHPAGSEVEARNDAPTTTVPADANDEVVPPNPVAGTPAGGRPPWLEVAFAWLFAYPLYPLQIVLLWAVSWLGLGSGLGLGDLLWPEEPYWQALNGLAVAMLFTNILTIRYLLDRRPGAPPVPSISFRAIRAGTLEGARDLFGRREKKDEAEEPSPAGAGSLYYFSSDDEVERLGHSLLWLLVPALLIFYVPKWFAPGAADLGYGWGMAFGLLLGVLVAVATTRYFDYRFTTTEPRSVSLRSLIAAFPAFRDARMRDAQFRLHYAVGMTIVAPFLFLAAFVVTASLRTLGESFPVIVWPPVVLVCLILALVNAVHGLVAFHFAGLQYVLVVQCALIGIVGNAANTQKMSFPGLEDYDARKPDERVDLDNLPDGATADLQLVDTGRMLENFHAKWAAANGHKGADAKTHKPKLVIVANSGGGIRAAVWTAAVLEGLEGKDGPGGTMGFRNHIRLMTGASGGMVAAGLYVAAFEDGTAENRAGGKPPLPKLSDQLAEDSLWRTVQTMLLHDLPSAGVPWGQTWDRGRSLEGEWFENTRAEQKFDPVDQMLWSLGKGGKVRSPFEMTFGELKGWKAAGGAARSEEGCDRPSLIFSPMLVEDCRRLLITNLDLRGQTEISFAALNEKLPAFAAATQSVPVIEFWRAFPGAYDKFRLGTAARMSATFPFVGPGVSLPTRPPRRVVDAGYFDNFGINLAAAWLWRHREKIVEHTSGVVIVEVRAYPRRLEKLYVDPTAAAGNDPVATKPRKPESLMWALSEVSTPAEAIVNLYARGEYFRNDLQMEILDAWFNGAARPTGDEYPFFTTVAFECDTEAALSWTLPAAEKKAILESYKKNEKQAKNLAAWFKTGGT